MELFVPKANGFVVPNDRLLGASRPGSVALGGGPSITIQITQPLGTPEAIARAVRDALARSSSRGYGLRDCLSHATVHRRHPVVEVRRRHLD